MGREIDEAERVDTDAFNAALRRETALLMGWFRDQALEHPDTPMIGLELEAWLLDENRLPAPENMAFLEALDHPLAVPELARFNFEFNANPAELSGRVFSDLETHLGDLWGQAREAAGRLGLDPMMIGVPPTLREEMLNRDFMTPSRRYELLDERLFELRGGAPLEIEIGGRDRLHLVQDHLMLEGACTSLQVHLMVPPDQSGRYYNAFQIASAPALAAAANSPFLYGRRLWEETRIAAFERAIDLRSFRDRTGRTVGRVTFGSGHLRRSMMELFIENLEAYPPLLPIVGESEEDPIAHLKLQNGTIWRWNRPIVHVNKAGTPHIRVENRCMPAGPTLTDMVANTAFVLGLTLALVKQADLEQRLDFETARANFYSAAKRGLAGRAAWLDDETGDLQSLILNRLADEAAAALIEAGVDRHEAEHYLGLIRARALNGQTGAGWQRAHANCHGRDFQKLAEDYLERQNSGRPVHSWTV